MAQLPEWLAHAPPWLQAIGLVLFLGPFLLTAVTTAGNLFRARADARAIDGNTIADGWGRLSKRQDDEIVRLQALIAEKDTDLARGWNLARGCHEEWRQCRGAREHDLRNTQLRLDRLHDALALPPADAVARLAKLLDAWPPLTLPPEVPPLDEVHDTTPDEYARRPQSPKDSKDSKP